MRKVLLGLGAFVLALSLTGTANAGHRVCAPRHVVVRTCRPYVPPVCVEPAPAPACAVVVPQPCQPRLVPAWQYGVRHVRRCR